VHVFGCMTQPDDITEKNVELHVWWATRPSWDLLFLSFNMHKESVIYLISRDCYVANFCVRSLQPVAD